MWLLKTEPTEYSYDDLEREKRGRWTVCATPWPCATCAR